MATERDQPCALNIEIGLRSTRERALHTQTNADESGHVLLAVPRGEQTGERGPKMRRLVAFAKRSPLISAMLQTRQLSFHLHPNTWEHRTKRHTAYALSHNCNITTRRGHRAAATFHFAFFCSKTPLHRILLLCETVRMNVNTGIREGARLQV